MKIKLNQTSSLFNLFIIFTAIISIVDIFEISVPVHSPDSRIVVAILVVILVISRLKKPDIIHPKLKTLNTVLFPLLLLSSIYLLLLEMTHLGNYVLNNYGVSYSRLTYFTFASGTIWIYGQSLGRNVSAIKKIIFMLPALLFLLALFIYVRNHQLYRFLIEEDSVVEYLQAFLFLLSSVVSLLLARYWRYKNSLLVCLFLLAGIGFFLVAGEEISWGQRLLNIETPEHIAVSNTQNEINLHNNEKLFGLVYRGYMLIGLLGGTLWLFVRYSSDKLGKQFLLSLKEIVPGWFVFPYFFTAFLYNLDRVYIRPRPGESLWEEPMELLLILGISIFLISRLVIHYKTEKFPEKKLTTPRN